MFRLLMLAGVNVASLSHSKTTDKFKKRFNLVFKDNKLVEIRDRSLSLDFSVRPYIEFIKKKLQREQELMNEKGDYESLVESYFEDDYEKGLGAENKRHSRLISRSLLAMKNVDFDKVFSHPSFRQVVSQFEKKMGEELFKIRLDVLARPNDPKYFHKLNRTYQIVKWALDFAKKRLSTVPLLNTASFVIVQVEKLIRERRMFHQNMLLHYFENFSEADLGVSKEDVDLAVSSIYESRIQWFAFWESNYAASQWKRYGMDKFYANVRGANATWRKSRGLYTGESKKVNFAFRTAVYKNEKVIVNLFNKESMLQNRPAIAHYINHPERIKRKRTLIHLAELGMSYLSLPSFIKSMTSNVLKSYYQEQKLTEGSLYGYFESMGSLEELKIIEGQYLNPFDNQLLL